MFRHFIEANLGSGYDYELEVKYLLIRLGFKASLTGNDDRGVDIIAQASTPGNPKGYTLQGHKVNRGGSKTVQGKNQQR